MVAPNSPLAIRQGWARFSLMKVLSIEEAQRQLAAVCNEALGGEVIRVQLENGQRIQLTPVGGASSKDLAECYEDANWAEFENNCGKASD
jgi:hypothetical protein